MKNISKFSQFLFLGFIFFFGCSQEEVDQGSKPFNQPYYNESEWAALSEELFLTLEPHNRDDLARFGRVLFYDKFLSLDGKVSCGSCHNRRLGFGDDQAFSVGVDGQLTKRNSIALASIPNLGSHYSQSSSSIFASQPALFWDEREKNMSEQVLNTIENQEELGISRETLLDLITEKPHYQVLHSKAFPDSKPQYEDGIEAIRRFISTIGAISSEFDEAAIQHLRSHEDISTSFNTFSINENRGKDLFLKHCNSCHGSSFGKRLAIGAEKFPTVANNGLDMNYRDKGVGAVTQIKTHHGVFKIPSLKNIELTAPYMHDGRFETLEQVINFYNEDIQNHINLDHRLKENGLPKKLEMDDDQKEALVAFLRTLTDDYLIFRHGWSDPFKN